MWSSVLPFKWSKAFYFGPNYQSTRSESSSSASGGEHTPTSGTRSPSGSISSSNSHTSLSTLANDNDQHQQQKDEKCETDFPQFYNTFCILNSMDIRTDSMHIFLSEDKKDLNIFFRLDCIVPCEVRVYANKNNEKKMIKSVEQTEPIHTEALETMCVYDAGLRFPSLFSIKNGLNHFTSASVAVADSGNDDSRHCMIEIELVALPMIDVKVGMTYTQRNQIHLELNESSSNGLDIKRQRKFVELASRETDRTCLVEIHDIYGMKDLSKRKSIKNISDIGNGETETNQECTICMSRSADTVMLPCRHLCACKYCAKILCTPKQDTNYLQSLFSKCPICRNHIESTLHLPDLASEYEVDDKPQ